MLLLLLFISTVSATCQLTPEELHEARVASMTKEYQRFYLDNYPDFYNLSLEIFDESVMTHYIQRTGVFGPADVISYAGLLVPRPPIVHPDVRQYPRPEWFRLELLRENLYKLPQVTLSFAGYIEAIDDYGFKFDGTRNVQYFEFEECSDQIKNQASSVDLDQNNFYVELNQNAFNVMLTCQIGYGACINTPYFNLTQFGDFTGCLTGYTEVENDYSPCPGPFTSDTILCRSLHGVSALFEPQVHCAHLPAVNSPVCYDRCLPSCNACASLDSHAHCVDEFSETNVINGAFSDFLTYHCECDDGYVGDPENGGCQLTTCQADYQCTSGKPFGYCKIPEGQTTGTCACSNNLSWHGDTGICGCLDSQRLFWNHSLPYCLRKGKCYEKWQCPQHSNTIQCRQYTYPNNLSPGDWCLCNPGYENDGVDQDCICGEGKIEKWAPVVGGNVCLAHGECTESWHCHPYTDCQVNDPEIIGTCVY